jgi:hypothetical protein
MQITHLLLTKPLHQEFFGVFLFFPKKTSMTPYFHKDFLGNQSFNTKKKSNWCLFQQISSENSSDILKPIKKPERQPEHHEITLKLSFDCMNNEKSFCIFACEKAKLVVSNFMHLK